ncbi:MAG: tRNA (adenosine(37)-N6)-dimethylallyltransferase MiaA [Gammaproteobacteria bacterium]|jgi:tRNA dimethylallyltransferase|nr:tRNA (adenosine(37)-N6)-dimethylallyltransferase MiaA [Gammaproteobacteria bacterium]MBQ0775045.1 tRNA (adenosine(37)-N6)-dimethylallyltransferase MiaA [Gammaproteobacteria bacterium]
MNAVLPKPVVFLMGPTCSGKTALAVELAQRLPVDIINCDSALVYEGLEIGAAKPEPEILAVAPHRLLGFRALTDPYSAAVFREDALREIEEIHAKGRIPLLVGGTMLYFKALAQGLADLPAANPAVRERLAAQAVEMGWPAMHARLAEVDAITAARLKPMDSQRIQRALEVFEVSGVPLSEHHRQQAVSLSNSDAGHNSAFPYTLLSLAVAPESRAVLHERIAVRFAQMLDAGLIAEVEQLRARREVNSELPAMKSVGYRQVWEYLDGQYDYETMVDRAVIATRQLAKRQFTWLRGWPALTWLNSDADDVVEQAMACLAPLRESVFSSD